MGIASVYVNNLKDGGSQNQNPRANRMVPSTRHDEAADLSEAPNLFVFDSFAAAIWLLYHVEFALECVLRIRLDLCSVHFLLK